jgi:hypothetical protein
MNMNIVHGLLCSGRSDRVVEWLLGWSCEENESREKL